MKIFTKISILCFVSFINLESTKALDSTYIKFCHRCIKQSGCFTFYRDTTNGQYYLELSKSQLNKPYLFTMRVKNAAPETFLFQGLYMQDGTILKMNKVNKSIEFSTMNNNFYVDPASPMHKVKDANVTSEIHAREPIVVEDELNGRYIINVDSLFLSEKLANFKLYYDPEFPLKAEEKILGEFNYSKSKINKIKSFQNNAVIQTSLNFTNTNLGLYTKALSHKGPITTLPYNSIAIEVSFLLFSLPEKEFEQRKSDSRIGYWVNEQDDLLNNGAKPWHDYISRWRLEKKNPNAAISDPINPIIYYLDNATPYEYRDIIIDAVQRWDKAFLKAGFSNAIICKMEPEDEEFDPDDLDKNMLVWTAGAIAGFIGYGPSIFNPLNGEILGADIILDYAVFSEGIGLDLIHSDLRGNNKRYSSCQQAFNNSDRNFCLAYLTSNQLEEEKKKFMIQNLQDLVLHEVGHTLGLTHNFKASTLLKISELENSSIVKVNGISNSVMDYIAPNLSQDLKLQTDYFQINPGVYDCWAIEYAYSPGLPDPKLEKERLNQIALRSNQSELAFGNDSDASNETSVGIDPYIIRYDLSSEPVNYAVKRMDLIEKASNRIIEKHLKAEESTQTIFYLKSLILNSYIINASIIAAHVGGVKFNRSQNAEEITKPRFEAISSKLKRDAMNALILKIFAPEAYAFLNPVYPFTLEERRNFEAKYYETNDPKIQEDILLSQKLIFDQLLNPTVLARQVNSSFYGNAYTLDDLFNDLSKGLFETDLKSKVNPIRQNVQLEYINRLNLILSKDSKYLASIQAVAMNQLIQIFKWLHNNKTGGENTKAHRHLLSNKIMQTIYPPKI